MHGARPHSSPALMTNAQLVPDRHSFTTATLLVSLNLWARAALPPSIAVLVFFFPKLGSIPASSECPAGVRFTSLSLQRQHITGEVWPFLQQTVYLCLSPSCMFSPFLPPSRQPRCGSRGPPGRGRARKTLFSRTSNPFLPSIRVRVVPFGVVHLSPARTGSSQVTRSSTAPTPSLLTTGQKVPDHTTCPASQRSKCNERKKRNQKVTYLSFAAPCFVSFSSFFCFLLFSSLCLLQTNIVQRLESFLVLFGPDWIKQMQPSLLFQTAVVIPTGLS
ncbi:unnamed protein product [Acanthosepion pharaonis]|uniref:Transmembrane protein n=1 Tax=Acanthosepion pharaonis TaxID=158019 RepID=A0A812DU20_ACAPH|nr:unnamed protein product [Sepia pharaonis]